MSRLPVFLAATLSLLLCSLAFSQTPTGTSPVRPSSPSGAAVPGGPVQPQPGTARIRGRIVAAQTGAPLRRAQVALQPPTATAPRSTTTDGDGRFEFAQMPAGRYLVMASKTGYVQLQYGQRRPTDSATPIILAERRVLGPLARDAASGIRPLELLAHLLNRAGDREPLAVAICIR